MMFSAFCPTHDATVLMTRRNVIGFVNTVDGAVLHWRCTCGQEGRLGRDGSTADDHEPPTDTSKPTTTEVTTTEVTTTEVMTPGW